MANESIDFSYLDSTEMFVKNYSEEFNIIIFFYSCRSNSNIS